VTPLEQRALEGNPISASVAISTRDRGDSVGATIASLLSNDWPEFELVVVDQSTDDRTRDCVRLFGSDPRLRYVRTSTTGLSASRNIALAEATHDLVVMTDDDCVVASNFVRMMIEEMRADPSLTLVFADVFEGSPRTEQWTPINRADSSYSVSSLDEWTSNDAVNIGIGAAMAFRSSAVARMGGFDELLGAGAAFRSGEDTDLALRVLLCDGRIRRTTRTWVYHYGARDIGETRELIRNGLFGAGAACGKLIRSGHPTVLAYLWRVFWATVVVAGWAEVKRGRRPPVLGRAVQLGTGLLAGLRQPAGGHHLLFDPLEV
jgi:GT2 family glycosyltransferase